jgi:hypothetical protein
MKLLGIALLTLVSGCASQSNYRRTGDFSVYEYSPNKWHIMQRSDKTTPQAITDRLFAKKALVLCPLGYSSLPELDYFEVTSSTPKELRAQSEPTREKWSSIWVRCN